MPRTKLQKFIANLRLSDLQKSCFKKAWPDHSKTHDPLIDFAQYRFTGSLRPCYPLSNPRTVPKHIKRPDYATHPEGRSLAEEHARKDRFIEMLSFEEQRKMRKVCQLARKVMDIVAEHVKPGITTDYIDKIVHEEAVKRDCYPSPLNYYNFPKSCCTSVNEVICHGIPDQYVLKENDLLNVDITLYHDGFHGDLNETFIVGATSITPKNKHLFDLLQATHDAMNAAIQRVEPAASYKCIGHVIQGHINKTNYSIVRSYTGHGCHRLFHCPPSIPHYGENKAYMIMKPGHCFTIEPMINMGDYRDEKWPDNWTVVTKDGKLSAQFEQTILVTENGHEVLTKRKLYNGRPYFLDCLYKTERELNDLNKNSKK